MLEFLRSLTPLPEDGWWRQSSFIGHFQLLAKRAPDTGDGSVEGFIARVAPSPIKPGDPLAMSDGGSARHTWYGNTEISVTSVWCSHRGFFAANERKPTQIGRDLPTIIDGSLSINA